MKILMAICTKGKVTIEHEYCLMMQLWPLGHYRDFFVAKGHTIENARNLAAHRAIAQDFDVLFFYDDDILPTTVDAVQQLITVMDQNEKVEVLAGVYPRRTPIPEPVCSEVTGGGPFWGWRDGKIHECYMVGTGFTMYRVKALKRLIDEGLAPEYKVKSGNIESKDVETVKVRKFFRIDTQTDDFNFSMDFGESIRQFVHGGVVCQQVDLKTGGVWDLDKSDTTSLIVERKKVGAAGGVVKKKRAKKAAAA